MRKLPDGPDYQPGTILGPNDMGEYLVVTPDGKHWAYASETDIAEAKREIRLRGPRSMTEWGISLVMNQLQRVG